MKKQTIIIIIIFILSFFSAFAEPSFITNPDNIIPLLFTLFGLSFIGYLFICNTLSEIVREYKVNDSENKKINLKSLLDEFEQNMLIIFIFAISIIIADIIFKLQIIPDNALKYIISASSGYSFYSFYDSISAMFKLLRHRIEN